MKKSSFCIIGQGNSGKSSLCGYLKAKEQFSSMELFEKEVLNIQKKCEKEGIKFDRKSIYTYFSDNLGETIRNKGNTKTMHYISLKEYNINLIDIPGLEHEKKDKKTLKSINNFDYCFFAIDIRSVDKIFFHHDKRKDQKILEYFHVAYSIFKSKLILLLTKCDLLNENEVQDIYSNIKLLFELENMDFTIVPIGININNFEAEDINIFNKKFDWYKGETIINILKNKYIVREREQSYSLGNFLNEYKVVENKKAKILRFIITNGNFEIGDEVNIGPIKYKENLIFVKAKIKEIRNEEKKNIDFCSSGSIVTMDFEKVSYSGKEINKIDLSTSNVYPFIYTDDVKIKEGNLLRITHEKPVFLSNNESYTFMWFNKKISCKCLIDDNQPYKTLELHNTIFIPSVNDNIIKNDFVITKNINNSYYNSPMLYYNAYKINILEVLKKEI